MSVTTVAALPRLALLQTVIESFACLMRHRGRFVPVVLAVGVVLSFLQPLLDHFASADVRVAVVCMVHLAVYACLAYMWCRLVLFSEWVFDGGAGVRAPFTWIQFRGFLCYFVLIFVGMPTLATVSALALVPTLGIAVACLLSGLLFSLLIARLSFVLPAAALQLPTSFLESWNHTTGQGLRLWSIYASAVVPAAAVIAGLGLVYAQLPDSTAILFMLSFATWCVGLVSSLAVSTMVSIAYERIVGLPARARRLDRMVAD